MLANIDTDCYLYLLFCPHRLGVFCSRSFVQTARQTSGRHGAQSVVDSAVAFQSNYHINLSATCLNIFPDDFAPFFFQVKSHVLARVDSHVGHISTFDLLNGCKKICKSLEFLRVSDIQKHEQGYKDYADLIFTTKKSRPILCRSS